MSAIGTIRVTKEFNFEMAHALYGYDGPCKNIHGHSYKLSVTVFGKINNDSTHPKQGMVVDFSEIKSLVDRLIIKELDHALMLNENSPHYKSMKNSLLFDKIIFSPFQPTCENLVLYFIDIIQKKLPASIKLHHIRLRETPTSYAEWFADDN